MASERPLDSTPDGNGAAEGAAATLERAANRPWLDVLARTGFAVMALLHVLIGAIALQVALGGYGEAETSGAIGPLARAEPFGPVLMWAGCVACAALAVWQLAEATVRMRREKMRARVAKAISSGSLFVIYGSVALTFASFARGRGRDSGESISSFSRTVLNSAAGIPALAGVGALILGIGAYFIYKGSARRFRPELRYFEDTRRGRVLNALGVVGHIAKGVALVLVGLLFAAAAFNHRPQDSTGLDGSLRTLLQYPVGVPVILVIAVGLICYGVFALVRARWGRM